MVLADAESEITREKSRGLTGGSFLLATILNRKDAKSKKGKEAVDAFKDFFQLKSDATFCQLFLNKYDLDENIDNTPIHIRKLPAEKMLQYLHNLVAECIRDLIPYFKNIATDMKRIRDFPLGEGRRHEMNTSYKSVPKEKLTKPMNITTTDAFNAVEAFIDVNKESRMKTFMVVDHSILTRKKSYSCSICTSTFNLEAICLTHIASCWKQNDVKSSEEPEPMDSVLTCECKSPTRSNIESAMCDEVGIDRGIKGLG